MCRIVAKATAVTQGVGYLQNHENIAQTQYPIFLISLMLKDKFNSISHIKFNDSMTEKWWQNNGNKAF